MAKSKEPIFKCPNDIKVNVSKFNGEVILDEECCTSVSVILKNTGEIATSFFGAHNPEVIKMLDKTLRMYFKGIKKTLKQEYKKQSEEEIKVVDEDLKEESKWDNNPVPEVKEDKKEEWIKESVENSKNATSRKKKSTTTTPKKTSKK